MDYTKIREKENLDGCWHSEEYDVPALDGVSSDKTLSLIYDTSSRFHQKDKNQSL